MLRDRTTDYHRDGFVFFAGLLSTSESAVMVRETERLPGSERRADRILPERPEVSGRGTSSSFRYADNDTVTDLVANCGIVAPTGPPGSTTFMHVNTLHGSTANLSPWPRRMITLTYNAMSNMVTSPSTRPKHIVCVDRQLGQLVALHANCVEELAESPVSR